MTLRFRAVKARKRKTDPTHPRKASVCPRALFFLFFIVWNQMPTTQAQVRLSFLFFSSSTLSKKHHTSHHTPTQPHYKKQKNNENPSLLSSSLSLLPFQATSDGFVLSAGQRLRFLFQDPLDRRFRRRKKQPPRQLHLQCRRRSLAHHRYFVGRSVLFFRSGWSELRNLRWICFDYVVFE